MATTDEFTSFGFAVGSLHGKRMWRVAADGTLEGLVHRGQWASGVVDATCERSPYVRVAEKRPVNPVKVAPFYDSADTYPPEPTIAYVVDYKLVPDPDYSTRKHPKDGDHLTDCKCGFYAYFNGIPNTYEATLSPWMWLLKKREPPLFLTGVIEGFGKTVIGEKGFRCARARIVALCIPPYVSADDYERLDLTKSLYPDVPFYLSPAEMFQEHPLDEPPAIDPEAPTATSK